MVKKWSRSHKEPHAFGPLEPEPLEKIPGPGAAWGKKSGAGAAKNYQAPSPGENSFYYHTYFP